MQNDVCEELGIASIVHVVSALCPSRILNDLLERCGWQGLFSYNQISELALNFQGNYIAEDDTLVLCIRSSF